MPPHNVGKPRRDSAQWGNNSAKRAEHPHQVKLPRSTNGNSSQQLDRWRVSA
jgi:hypothetical protein